MASPVGTRFEEKRGALASGAASGPSRRCPSCGEQYPLDFVVCPKDASALERPELGDDPLFGEVLAGAFCITGVLGEGGMGRVYSAEHVRLPKRFAIKVMQEELVKHPDALARFEREAQAMARVSSEHVIEVVDLVRLKDGRPCLVTELLEGEELGEKLEQKGKIKLEEAITIGRQVCRGLAAAHAVGVVHRDLKPSNLFLIDRGDGLPFAKVLDFGVAKLSDGANLTRTGMVVGTPAYMSPEQARGDKGVDERADVYSLGAVLYHMLTGSAPFVGDEPGVVLTRVLTEDPPRPRELDFSIPDDVERLVMRALAREPDDRPRTAVDFERELAAVDPQREVPVSKREPEPPPAPRDTLDHVVVHQAPKKGRASAMVSAIAFSLALGAAVFAAATAGLRVYAARKAVRDSELQLLAVAAGIAAAIALATALRSLVARWRNAHAIDKLGRAYAAAIAALFAATGLLALVYADYGVFGAPLDARVAPFVDLLLVALPIVFGILVFLVQAGAHDTKA